MFTTNYKLQTANCLLIIIIIIAAFLRLYNITELPPGLYPDEAMNGNNALEAISTGNWKVFYPENNGREGLFINIQALSIFLFGNFPWALRIVSAIFGILTVLGVYFLTKELFNNYEIQNKYENTKLQINEKIALLSAFLAATSFWHINFSRIGFRAIMAPMFLTWSLYLLLKALNQVKNKFQAPSAKFQINYNNQNSKKFRIWDFRFWILPVLAGLVYGLGFHSYIAYRATPLLILIIIALYWFQNPAQKQVLYRASKEWQIRKKILLVASGYTLMTIIIFTPLGLYFLKNPQDFMGRTTQVSVFNSPAPIKDLTTNIIKTAGMFNFSGDYNWRHNYAGKPLLFWPVGILLLIGVFLAVKSLIQNLKIKNQNDNSKLKIDEISPATDTKFSFLMLFLWILIASLPIVISNEGLPHALRAILMAPPVFILAGFGGIWLIEKIKNQKSHAYRQAGKIKNTSQNSKILKILNFTLSFYILIFAFFIWLTFDAYKSYFIDWGKNPNVQGAFAANYVQIGQELNKLPKELLKYVIVEAGGTDVRGIPMPTQTIMFITDTFTSEKQKEKNIYYVLPNETNKIPPNSYSIILK